MSSEKFESLEDDLTSLVDRLKNTVDRKIPQYAGEERKSAVRQAERNVDEANLIIQEMEEEAKMAPISYRTQMIGKIRNYKRDLEQINKTLKRGGEYTPSGSDNYGFDRDDRLAASQRSKLFKGTQSLNRTSESLARTHQIAAETDQIGVEIIDELGQQREQLVRTKERVSNKDQTLI
ncbi:hypothetical protein KUTeg_013863 [Tegillarca granosa]|uniref:Vesicle transport v-SNARE N-terminal domain-containing protein n=1 Tax=Tegillarca granosa TaxID=220873 RepID=A0ABQ9EUY2_TEGGR|nr:hypothetical protein KUTeg_013863 [Tegillarca granosa]